MVSDTLLFCLTSKKKKRYLACKLWAELSQAYYEHYKHAKILLCICESSRKKIEKRKINRINNERERGERAKRIKKNNKKLVLIIIIAYFCTRIKNKS